ncbi:helix-turn-helix domain-containing protein, partial [Salmonella enterica subsp. enterica serovar Corvallis]
MLRKKHEASRRCSMSMELMVKAMKIRVGNPLRKLVL